MRKKWTMEMIGEELMKYALLYSPARMPTNTELIELSGGYALSGAIQKTGGFVFWANRLGLPTMKSDTLKGQLAENYIAGVLKDHGLEVQRTTTKFPYDLLVQGCVKIDVKTASVSYVRGYPIHAYKIGKPFPTCDFYICLEDDTKLYYVIPAHLCQGQSMIEMGIDSQKYAPYKMATHLVDKACEFYRSI